VQASIDLKHSYWRTLMNKYWMGCCAGLLVTMSFPVFAQSDDKAAEIAEAEQGCLAATQKRYDVAADAVTQKKTKTKWSSGLRGYAVNLAVTKKSGKKDDYVCVAKRDGTFKFYEG
jgi:hypothetical protein